MRRRDGHWGRTCFVAPLCLGWRGRGRWTGVCALPRPAGGRWRGREGSIGVGRGKRRCAADLLGTRGKAGAGGVLVRSSALAKDSVGSTEDSTDEDDGPRGFQLKETEAVAASPAKKRKARPPLSKASRQKISKKLKGRKLSAETKEKLSVAAKMAWAERKKAGEMKLKRTREVQLATRERISQALRGRKMPEEVKAKISAALKGRKFSTEHRAALKHSFTGEKNPRYGRTLTEETKRRISETMKDHHRRSPKTRKEKDSSEGTAKRARTGSRRAKSKTSPTDELELVEESELELSSTEEDDAAAVDSSSAAAASASSSSSSSSSLSAADSEEAIADAIGELNIDITDTTAANDVDESRTDGSLRREEGDDDDDDEDSSRRRSPLPPGVQLGLLYDSEEYDTLLRDAYDKIEPPKVVTKAMNQSKAKVDKEKRRQELTQQRSCVACQGKGRLPCSSCIARHGVVMLSCPRCFGVGIMVCENCDGSGVLM